MSRERRNEAGGTDHDPPFPDCRRDELHWLRQRVSTVLGRLDGISGVQANHRAGTVSVDYDPAAVDETTIAAGLAEAGYELADGAQ